MTQEEKQLLLIDLCARLPHRVNVLLDLERQFDGGSICTLTSIKLEETPIFNVDVTLHDCSIEELRPYLRPMSSMTEEERKELKQEHVKDEKLYAECLTRAANGDNSMRGKVITHFAADWCNKNHFDYRGLIPMGLALEAKEGMYKTE